MSSKREDAMLSEQCRLLVLDGLATKGPGDLDRALDNRTRAVRICDDDRVLEAPWPKVGAVVVGLLEKEDMLSLLFAVLGLLDATAAIAVLNDEASLRHLAHQKIALHEEILLGLAAWCKLRHQKSMLCHKALKTLMLLWVDIAK